MLEIDGSEGEGGGQILRTSLSLSALTGQAVRIKNVRAGRSKPGLMRQHLAGFRAVSEICGGELSGDQLRSTCVEFTPGRPQAGEYQFRVGTAGSTTLIAQTVLPVLMLADSPSTVRIQGGTHNPGAPAFDFLQRVFLPQLNRMGLRVDAQLNRYGFYPAGGGEIELKITPAQQLTGLNICDPPKRFEKRVTAIVANLPQGIAERECDVIRRKTNWHADCFQVVAPQLCAGPGNVILIELDNGNVTEVFSVVGKQGVKAEAVARSVLREARAYISAAAPVGPYLADQLLLPMGIAANMSQTSEFVTSKLTRHAVTHIELLKRFLSVDIHIKQLEDGNTHIRLAPLG